MRFYEFGAASLPVLLLLPGTTVHCFYAAGMGRKYAARYRLHFKDPDIRRFELQHEELLVRYPEKWVAEVRACCGLSRHGEPTA